jgi:hypothetical protein
MYWNVTGNGWTFPIDRASATVTLPPNVSDGGVTLSGYTGPLFCSIRSTQYPAVAAARCFSV